MDEARFKQLARRAKLLTSDYGAGYQRGLRRCYHGEAFGTADEYALWSRMGLDGDHREEMGRGYRDGLAGIDPAPAVGRPSLPPGAGKPARIELRTTAELADKAMRLADAAGVSRNAWIERLIERAKS